MPNTQAPTAQQNQEQRSAQANDELRRVISNSYAFIEGQRAVRAFAAVTYEELAQAQNDRIEGTGTDLRPSALERVGRIEGELLAVVDQIRRTPPEYFLLADDSTDVNTPVEQEEA